MSIMYTRSGRKISLHEPNPRSIEPFDIAYSLARIPRFNGHTVGMPYSVAQHSCILMNYFVTDLKYVKIVALLHDAHEAYIGDITAPVKKMLDGPALRRLFMRMDEAIFKRLNVKMPVPHKIHTLVHIADKALCQTEMRDVMAIQEDGDCLNGVTIDQVWDCFTAEKNFMTAMKQLGLA